MSFLERQLQVRWASRRNLDKKLRLNGGPEYAKPGPEYAKPGPEYAKPGPEYAKPRPWAPLGGSLGQSREDVGHILGSFGEPSGVKKGRGKRLRSFSTEC